MVETAGHAAAQARRAAITQAGVGGLERYDSSSNRHPALAFCLSMIFSENRFPLFRIMLEAADLFQRPLLPLGLIPSSRPREEMSPHLADQPTCGADCRSSAWPVFVRFPCNANTAPCESMQWAIQMSPHNSIGPPVISPPPAP